MAPHHGRKRKLGEVTPPAFVASNEDGGAYDIVEMPKRYMHGYMADKEEFVHTKIMATYQVLDAEFTAMNSRIRLFAADIIRQMKAQDAARAGQAGHDSASSV